MVKMDDWNTSTKLLIDSVEYLNLSSQNKQKEKYCKTKMTIFTPLLTT